ncbi:MAG: hypothetical protein PHR44_08100 [Candidatus Omnitrophica bacterium]|nr:hypothetical protein [Candidatus Omnitrophota bacterium]
MMLCGKRKKMGQIATLITLLLAALILFAAVAINIGHLSQRKLSVEQAADAASFNLANNLGSFAHYLSHKFIGDRDHKCKFNWGFFFSIVAAAFLMAVGFGGFLGLTGAALTGAQVGAVLATIGVAAQAILIEPAMVRAVNRQFAKMTEQMKFREGAIQTALFKIVDDPVKVADEFDLDEDGEVGCYYYDAPNPGQEPVCRERRRDIREKPLGIKGDKIGRFSRWYVERLKNVDGYNKDLEAKIAQFKLKMKAFWDAEQKFMQNSFRIELERDEDGQYQVLYEEEWPDIAGEAADEANIKRLLAKLFVLRNFRISDHLEFYGYDRSGGKYSYQNISSSIYRSDLIETFNDTDIKLNELLRVLFRDHADTITVSSSDIWRYMQELARDINAPVWSWQWGSSRGSYTYYHSYDFNITLPANNLVLTGETLPFYVPGNATEERAFSELYPDAGIVTRDLVEQAGLEWDSISRKLTENGWAEQVSQTEVRLNIGLDLEQGAMSAVFGSDLSAILSVLRAQLIDEDETATWIDFDAKYRSDSGSEYNKVDQVDLLKWGAEAFEDYMQSFFGGAYIPAGYGYRYFWGYQYVNGRLQRDYRPVQGQMTISDKDLLATFGMWQSQLYDLLDIPEGLAEGEIARLEPEIGTRYKPLAGHPNQSSAEINYDNWYDEISWVPDNWCTGEGELLEGETPVVEKGWLQSLEAWELKLTGIRDAMRDALPDSIQNQNYYGIFRYGNWDADKVIKEAIIDEINEEIYDKDVDPASDRPSRLQQGQDGSMTAFIKAIQQFRDDIELFNGEVEALQDKWNLTPNALYAWDDKAGIHVINVTVYPFKVPYLQAKKKWGGLKRCVYLRNKEGKVSVEVQRFDEPKNAIGFWNSRYGDAVDLGRITPDNRLSEIEALRLLGKGIRSRSYAYHYWRANDLARMVDANYEKPRYQCD